VGYSANHRQPVARGQRDSVLIIEGTLHEYSNIPKCECSPGHPCSGSGTGIAHVRAD
jgi:hypothetical protein